MTMMCLLAAVVFPAIEDAGVIAKVTLESARERIEKHEPLLLKVRATNTGDRAILLNPPLSSLSGNLRLECKPPGCEFFLQVRLPFLNGRPRRPDPNWEAGSAHAAYLFLSSESFVRQPKRAKADEKLPLTCLSTPGTWTFRATVVHGDGTLESNTIKVCVRGSKTPEPEKSASDAIRMLLSLSGVKISADKLEELEKHVKATPMAPLAHHLLLQLGRITHSSNQAARLDATKAFDVLMKEAEPLEQEYWRLVLGVTHYECGDYESARKALKSAPDEGSRLKSYLDVSLRGK